MMATVCLYLQGIKTALATRMAYRGDFFMSMLIMLLVELGAPFITFLIYGNGASFPGWTMYEVLLIQGVFLLARDAFPLLFWIVWNTMIVREDLFDLLLIKPKSTFSWRLSPRLMRNPGKLLGGIMLFGQAG